MQEAICGQAASHHQTALCSVLQSSSCDMQQRLCCKCQVSGCLAGGLPVLLKGLQGGWEHSMLAHTLVCALLDARKLPIHLCTRIATELEQGSALLHLGNALAKGAAACSSGKLAPSNLNMQLSCCMAMSLQLPHR